MPQKGLTFRSQSKFRMGVSLLAMFALLVAAMSFAGNADAAPAASEDQYLEQVPSGDGANPRSKDDFSESVGDSDGVVTDQDVSDQAAKNKQNQPGSPTNSDAPAQSQTNPPAAVQSVATAAKFGPFSQTQAMIIGGLVLVLSSSAVFMRVTA